MRGGKRKGAGRKPGSAKDRVKFGTTISRENFNWLEKKKSEGHDKSMLVDKGLDKLREEGE